MWRADRGDGRDSRRLALTSGAERLSLLGREERTEVLPHDPW